VDDALPGLAEPRPLGDVRLEAYHFVQVTARRKSPALAGKQHDADLVLSADVQQRIEKIRMHLLVDGVEYVGAIQRQPGYVTVHLEPQACVCVHCSYPSSVAEVSCFGLKPE
jgi:hypothetical protein